MGLNDILLEQALDATLSKISKIPLKIEIDDRWTVIVTAKEKEKK